ncbi:MAG: ABC transporter permease [Lachnospiraceae bacterium]|nr:ABC transporter permease [Lachnospiraceae bacterium]
MKGLSKVFSFTCRQIMGGKNYKGWTVVLALLFFLIPAVLMPLSERNRPDPDEAGHESDAPRSDEDYLARVKAVFYAAETEDGYSWNSLQVIDSIPVTRCSSAKEALRAAEQFGKGGYALLIREEKGRYSVNALMPDDAETDDLNTAMACANSFANLFPQLLGAEMQITSAQKAVLNAPIGIVYPEAEESDANAALREIANIALPYLNIMLIYFLVLFYGNTVANQVILEKTSKLMDTFLISVKPKAMVMGKVLAAWCTSLLQLGLWIAALVGGCSLGSFLARSIHPNSTMGILRFFDFLGTVMHFYSPLRILIALLIIAGGFLLYCSLAGLAGSFVSKPEELASSMQIFQLVLVASYLVVLLTSLRNISSAPQGIAWYDFVPFTAMMVTPVRLLMGVIPVWAGAACLGITVILAVLVTYLAGKVYSLMSLYKGSVPKPREMLKIIFGKA